MFARKTVFVIGAGASHEFQLPLGSELKSQICEGAGYRFEHYRNDPSKGDAQVLDWLRRKHGDHRTGQYDAEKVNAYTLAGNQLAQSMQSFVSIDEALHYFSQTSEIVELGKALIVQNILRAESQSILSTEIARIHRDANQHFDVETSGKWLFQFYEMAIAGLRRNEIENAFENVTIITFNYDRTIEYGLYWFLKLFGQVDAETAKKIVSGLKILRPYGSIGPLEWLRDGVKFGDRSIDPFRLIDQIKTYTEQQKYSSAEISDAIGCAQLVVFLGFGFHQSNVSILQVKEMKGIKQAAIFCTVKGIHVENHAAIVEHLVKHIPVRNPPRLLDMYAGEMLRTLRPAILLKAAQ